MAITFGGRSWVPREQAQTTTSSGSGSGSSGGGSSGNGWADLFRWASTARSAYGLGRSAYDAFYGGTQSGAGGAPVVAGADAAAGSTPSGMGAALEGSEAAYAGLTGEMGADAAASGYAGMGATGGADLSLDAAGGYYGGSTVALGSNAGSGAASQGMSGASAGAGASAIAQWIPVLAIAIMAYDAYTKGSGRNDPVADTREIQLGANELTNLSRGNEYTPGTRDNPNYALGRFAQVYDQGSQSMGQEWQPYTRESMGDLYRNLHSLSAGGTPRSTGRSAVTDADIDNYLTSQGVTQEELAQALGTEVPDWSRTTYSQWLADQWSNQVNEAQRAWESGDYNRYYELMGQSNYQNINA